ncbi:hypothetical protein [Streptomyces phaeochromogenes]
MNSPLTVLVLDDDKRASLGSFREFIEEGIGDPDRFIRKSLTDPTKLDEYLDKNPEVDIVLVDVDFERTSSATCLTAFQTLIRRNGPKAIGLAQSQYGRTLFPFAVCQLLPPPQKQIIVGWTYKDDTNNRGYPELIRILDKIASGERLTSPPSLARCLPDAARATGEFMQKILASRSDVKIWEMMATSHYSAHYLAHTASISADAVRRRFNDYLDAIVDFEGAMVNDDYHPAGSRAAMRMPSRQSEAADSADDKKEPRQRAIEVFAQAHRTFFKAPELEEIVKDRDLFNSKQRSRRRRRPEPPWWKPA